VKPALVATVALKALLVGLLLLAVLRPDLPQFEGKAMTGRAIGYPIAAAIVPVVWWIMRRRGHRLRTRTPSTSRSARAARSSRPRLRSRCSGQAGAGRGRDAGTLAPSGFVDRP
jgi:hypothetical protein